MNEAQAVAIQSAQEMVRLATQVQDEAAVGKEQGKTATATFQMTQALFAIQTAQVYATLAVALKDETSSPQGGLILPSH